MALAQSRGDAEPVWRRAAHICQEMNIAPWVALAVAERLIPLKEAALLDRAARCKELQPAILDERKTIDELRAHRPYAPYLLAADLVDALAGEGLTMPAATEIAESLLSTEAPIAEDGHVLPIRRKPLADYAAQARRIVEVMRRTGCPLSMAIDVGFGRTDEGFAGRYAEQKRRLENDEAQRRARPAGVRRPDRRPRPPWGGGGTANRRPPTS